MYSSSNSQAFEASYPLLRLLENFNSKDWSFEAQTAEHVEGWRIHLNNGFLEFSKPHTVHRRILVLESFAPHVCVKEAMALITQRLSLDLVARVHRDCLLRFLPHYTGWIRLEWRNAPTITVFHKPSLGHPMQEIRLSQPFETVSEAVLDLRSLWIPSHHPSGSLMESYAMDLLLPSSQHERLDVLARLAEGAI